MQVNPHREALVRLLADGMEHSGESLARTLGVSRAAVWKQVRTLGHLGLAVRSLPRRGYQLDRRLDLMDAELLKQHLALAPGSAFSAVRVEFEVESTNSELLAVGPPPQDQMSACIAEYQSSGRGRRGRFWIAPLASGLCLSTSWSFAGLPAQISSLGLVAGVAVAMALDSLDVPGVMLKWPNDLWIDGRKLGGILIEMRAETAGPTFVVIGVGLNVDLPDAARRLVQQNGVPPIDLHTALCATAPSRTLLASRIIVEMLHCLRRFSIDGFAPFLYEWRRRDALAGRSVTIVHPDRVVLGEANGIDEDGALLILTADRLRREISGDVSVRVAEA